MTTIIAQRLVCNTEWAIGIEYRFADGRVETDWLGSVAETKSGHLVPAELWPAFERFYAEYQEETAYNKSLRRQAMRPYRVEAETGALDRAATEREWREEVGA